APSASAATAASHSLRIIERSIVGSGCGTGDGKRAVLFARERGGLKLGRGTGEERAHARDCPTSSPCDLAGVGRVPCRLPPGGHLPSLASPLVPPFTLKCSLHRSPQVALAAGKQHEGY